LSAIFEATRTTAIGARLSIGGIAPHPLIFAQAGR
jgi:hypothetical protein